MLFLASLALIAGVIFESMFFIAVTTTTTLAAADVYNNIVHGNKY